MAQGRKARGSAWVGPDTDHRFTPPEIIAFRDAVWPEGTDTDPAWHRRSYSSARLTYDRGGLRKPWEGRVWLNPPWSDPTPWIERLVRHCSPLHTEHEGILCVRNDPSTDWWALVWEHAAVLALPAERVRYHQPKGRKVVRCGVPAFTTALFYFGAQWRNYLRVAKAHNYYAVTMFDPTAGPSVATNGRVRQLQAWIAEGAKTEVRTNEVMELLGCSRQTALRTLAATPNVRAQGTTKAARYLVIP